MTTPDLQDNVKSACTLLRVSNDPKAFLKETVQALHKNDPALPEMPSGAGTPKFALMEVVNNVDALTLWQLCVLFAVYALQTQRTPYKWEDGQDAHSGFSMLHVVEGEAFARPPLSPPASFCSGAVWEALWIASRFYLAAERRDESVLTRSVALALYEGCFLYDEKQAFRQDFGLAPLANALGLRTEQAIYEDGQTFTLPFASVVYVKTHDIPKKGHIAIALSTFPLTNKGDTLLVWSSNSGYADDQPAGHGWDYFRQRYTSAKTDTLRRFYAQAVVA